MDKNETMSNTITGTKTIEEAANGENQYLIILLNNEFYLINLTHITRLIKPVEIFPLPDTPEVIPGVINLSGEIIPMIDLKKALALPDLGLDTSQRFVICRYSALKIGILVDKIVDTISLDGAKIRVDTTKVQEKEFISGEYLVKKDIYGIIDITKIIDSTKA